MSHHLPGPNLQRESIAMDICSWTLDCGRAIPYSCNKLLHCAVGLVSMETASIAMSHGQDDLTARMHESAYLKFALPRLQKSFYLDFNVISALAVSETQRLCRLSNGSRGCRVSKQRVCVRDSDPLSCLGDVVGWHKAASKPRHPENQQDVSEL